LVINGVGCRIYYFIVGQELVVELDGFFVEVQQGVKPEDGFQKLNKQNIQGMLLLNMGKFMCVKLFFNPFIFIINLV